jgi:hypothetical protein
MRDEIVALCSRSSSSLLRCAPRLGHSCAAAPVAAVHWPLWAQVLLGTVLRGLETELKTLKTDVDKLIETIKKEMTLKVLTASSPEAPHSFVCVCARACGLVRVMAYGRAAVPCMCGQSASAVASAILVASYAADGQSHT